MKKIAALALLSSFLFTGCVAIIRLTTPYDIIRTRGWYGGDAVYELQHNVLLTQPEEECRSLFCYSDFQFNMRKYIVGTNVRMFVMMDYDPSAKTYMQTVEKIVIEADGKKITLRGSKEEGKSISAGAGSLERQRSYFDATNDELLKIAWAKKVKMTLQSRWYDTTVYFSSKNIDNVRWFYFNYLKPENR